MGWEPREFTKYVYEGDRLVATVTSRESEWRPADVALALAGEAFEANVGPHGIPMDVATNPDNQFAFKAPPMPAMDWAAKALGDAQDSYYNSSGKDAPRHGHLWRVELKDQSS